MKRSFLSGLFLLLCRGGAWGQTMPAEVVPANGTIQPAVAPVNATSPVNATQPANNAQVPQVYEFGVQSTVLWQQLYPFHSPYQGTNSLNSRGDSQVTETLTMYTGLRATQGLDLFLDAERVSGRGVSEALGLAGYTNGEAIRNPAIGTLPYAARYILRYTLALGNETEFVEGGENQIRGPRPTSRVVFSIGKMGTNDIFDANSYANSGRTQFENWALINAASYDYAADTRGYTQGIAVEYINPDWALRAGRFQMPTVANGPILDGNLGNAFGDQIELELHPSLVADEPHGALRLLAYRNSADMGNYQDALNLAAQTNTIPNITLTREQGTMKYGFGINFEQPLADNGATGVFARVGWNNGQTESFAYTECDRTYSLGMQLSGIHWSRPDDRVGIALVQNEISKVHAEYLAAGGLGFILGDGRLNYRPEKIAEAYYSFRISKPLFFSLDGQLIRNPGYNRDRGPAFVPSTRLHFEF